MGFQAYGYNFLPLLLSLASPPLAILLPNPLPASTPPTVTALKYPFVPLRKSLRLLIDDNPEALDEVENDISFVYSGYAPISVRLVQCVAQKGGVISNPAEKEKATTEAGSAQGKSPSIGKVQAHPIVGWKGFEDVVSAIPGETVDILQKGSGDTSAVPSMASLRVYFVLVPISCILIPPSSSSTRTIHHNGCILLRWLYLYRDSSP